MRIDIDHLTLPEPEAVLLLKDEVRRLRAAIAALAAANRNATGINMPSWSATAKAPL